MAIKMASTTLNTAYASSNGTFAEKRPHPVVHIIRQNWMGAQYR
jgi:hypothetical protein